MTTFRDARAGRRFLRSRGRLPAWAAALAIAALGFAAPGCAALGALFTPQDDYAAYRSTRTAPTFEARLAAAARYLDRFPRGEFAREVRAYYDAAEPAFFAAKSRSASGLDAYLRTLPNGPHRQQALTDLRRLRSARVDQEELRVATTLGARLSLLSAERARVRNELLTWVRRFLDPKAWDRPLIEAPAEVIVPWSLALPAPICGAPEAAPPGHARRCSKILELPYTVTARGAPEERQATIEIAMAQDAAGRPLDVAIGGPDLFVRIEETVAARAINTADRARRTSGRSRVVELVRLAFEDRISSDPACRKRPTQPAVLDLECAGFHVTIRGGLEGGDDTIRIRRESARTEAPAARGP